MSSGQSGKYIVGSSFATSIRISLSFLRIKAASLVILLRRLKYHKKAKNYLLAIFANAIRGIWQMKIESMSEI